MNNRIRQIRKDAGMSMAAFGDVIGISSTAVSFIENGRNGVSKQTIVAICNQFGVNEEWLRTGEGPVYKKNKADGDLYAWFGETLAEGNPNKIRFLRYVSKLEEADWDRIISFAKFMLGEED